MTASAKETEYLARLHELWAKAWPKGTPDKPQYLHGEVALTEYLRAWAKRNPEKPAVIFYGHVTTYAELDAQSDRFAALLMEKGVRKGDRVAVFLPNCPQFHIVFFGILKLGAIHVPVSPLSRAFELSYELNDTDAEVIVALDQLAPVVDQVRSESKLREVIVTSFADVLPAKPTIPVPDSISAPRIAISGATDLLPALAALPAPKPLPPAGLDDIAALNYTGGTTGMPKGCVHTQRDMVYTAAANHGISVVANEDSVFLSFFPEFWIAGENFGLIFPMFTGATLVLLARWDAIEGTVGNRSLQGQCHCDAGRWCRRADGSSAVRGIRPVVAQSGARRVLREEAQSGLSQALEGSHRHDPDRSLVGNDRRPIHPTPSRRVSRMMISICCRSRSSLGSRCPARSSRSPISRQVNSCRSAARARSAFARRRC